MAENYQAAVLKADGFGWTNDFDKQQFINALQEFDIYELVRRIEAADYICSCCARLSFESIEAESKRDQTLHYMVHDFEQGFEHQPSWRALKQSAADGCKICILLWAVLWQGAGGEAHLSRPGSLDERLGASVRIVLNHWYSKLADLHIQAGFHKHVISIALAAIEGTPAATRIDGRLTAINPLSESVVSQLRASIVDCIQNHKECPAISDSTLPSRVLDLGAADDLPPNDTVKLLCTDADTAKAPYVTLSHCWGANVPLTTTCDTLTQRTCRILWNELPRSFQDAVIVTKKLGYRYLWIDSLCILQDNKEDWARESSRMGEIYSKSIVTISAMSAPNSTVGFLAERDLAAAACCAIRFSDNAQGRKPIENAVYMLWPVPSGGEDYVGGRAWTLQELCLSPRVFQFGFSVTRGEREIVWKCQKHDVYEGGHVEEMTENSTKALLYHFDYRQSLPRQKRYGQHIYNVWRRLVCEFSSRTLSYETDRLPALAGLAAEIQKRTGDQYLAGLWKKQIVRDLLWSPERDAVLRRKFNSHMPSWSWASCTGALNYQHVMHEHILEGGEYTKLIAPPSDVTTPHDNDEPFKEIAGEDVPENSREIFTNVMEELDRYPQQASVTAVVQDALDAIAAPEEQGEDVRAIQPATHDWNKLSYTLEVQQTPESTLGSNLLGTNGNLELRVKGYLRQVSVCPRNGQYASFGTFTAPAADPLDTSQNHAQLVLECMRVLHERAIPAKLFSRLGDPAYNLARFRGQLRSLLEGFKTTRRGEEGLSDLEDFLRNSPRDTPIVRAALKKSWSSLSLLQYSYLNSPHEISTYMDGSPRRRSVSHPGDIVASSAISSAQSPDFKVLLGGLDELRPEFPRQALPPFSDIKCYLLNYTRMFVILNDEVCIAGRLDRDVIDKISHESTFAADEVDALHFMTEFDERSTKLLRQENRLVYGPPSAHDDAEVAVLQDYDGITTFSELVQARCTKTSAFWSSRCRLMSPSLATLLFIRIYSFQPDGEQVLGSIRFDSDDLEESIMPIWCLEVALGSWGTYTSGQSTPHGLVLVQAGTGGIFRRVGTYEFMGPGLLIFSQGLEKSSLTLI